jgi:hypothetical protein
VPPRCAWDLSASRDLPWSKKGQSIRSHRLCSLVLYAGFPRKVICGSWLYTRSTGDGARSCVTYPSRYAHPRLQSGSWTHAYSIVPPRSSSPFIFISPTFLRFIPHGDYGYVHPLTSDGYLVATVPGKGRLVISPTFSPTPYYRSLLVLTREHESENLVKCLSGCGAFSSPLIDGL